MKRPDDRVSIESMQGDGFSIVIDRATQYEIALSLRQPSMARFELGDESTWGPLREVIKIGGRFQVCVNGYPRITGRCLTRNMPMTVQGGVTVQLMIRTILADAAFSAVSPQIQVKNLSLKALVLKAFERFGLTEANFVFRGDLARDVITGRKSGQPSAAASIRARLEKLNGDTSGRSSKELTKERTLLETQLQGAEGRPVAPDLAAIQVQQANPQPGESIYQFVDRHLIRYGMMIWDAPDGSLVVGTPDDSQSPLYVLSAQKGSTSAANNLEGATKTEDFENVPTHLWVYGRDAGGKSYASQGSIKAHQSDPILASVDPPLDRIQFMVDAGITNQAMAEARARREMLSRSISKDNWSLQMDGLSYWSGQEQIPYSIDAVADLRVDVSDRADGPYLIHELTMTGSAEGGHTTKATACARGIWVI